ncbi:single-stranded DNA-binding protein Ssb [Thermacetogenium phaeum DSM 12270]|uniref:Single-stranded DNA-binding protein n=1 Tax=Thermacetogenium phaeum (strain ATCC BAA-254 / DSM 26808 / PB) TaxID=1089553 RepID=K4LED7_THEPS|nr:single-stranded DNA-binding protein [Thermacetogenium phaeum]AFV10320.1 single-stranded DNA-binding protein Ssb [Thermacetogenium phaeum DSM 12270]MDN5375538.1 single-strand DNA-binding protein [Thermacetogenium sp.]
MFLNRVILIGRSTREPELRFTGSGTAVANFTLAVDRPFLNARGERETDFIRVVVWRKLAETCANYMGKGRLVAVEGRLQVRSYQTPEGQTRTATEVVADTVRFLDRAREGATAAGPTGPEAAPESGEEPGFLDDPVFNDEGFGMEEPPF